MKWLAISGAAAVAVLATWVAFFGRFGYSSVCGRCGAIRIASEWRLPYTSVPVFRHSSIRQTPVSLCLTTNRILPGHSHQWVFAHGGGNGVRCALGPAHTVQFTVQSSQVAQVLDALDRYGERGFRDKVLTNIFDENTTHLVAMLIVPPGGFTDAEQLRAWISEDWSVLDETISAYRNNVFGERPPARPTNTLN